MGNLPLHPVIVHFPIVLAILAPLIALLVLIGQRTGRLSLRAWWFAAGCWGLLALTSFVAVQTGETDEEVVEAAVAESAIETHKERAEAFALSAYAVFVLSVLVMLGKSDRSRLVAGSVTLGAGLVIAGLAVGVGHSGGSLVYEYGAAAAHVGAGAGERLPLTVPDVRDERRRENREREHAAGREREER